MALEQVYPSVPRETIEALQEYEAYVVALDRLDTRVDGAAATVRGELSLTIRARSGITANAAGPAVFQLRQRDPGVWFIAST